MKIMLIQPSLLFKSTPEDSYQGRVENVGKIGYPLGLAYLGGMLEEGGHEVKIFDLAFEGYRKPKKTMDEIFFGMEDDKIIKTVEDFCPDYIGISCSYTSQAEEAHRIANLIKDEFKTVKMVLGGAHASALPGLILKNKNIDYVVLGEGEHAFLNLVNRKPTGGIAFRNDNKIIIRPPERIKDLNSLPFPAYHMLGIKKYLRLKKSHQRAKRSPFSPILTSRGCPNECFFCSIPNIFGRGWVARSAKNVVDEMELLYEKYGVREFQIEDDNFSINYERVERICNEIKKRGLDISWCTPHGLYINSLDGKIIKKMAETGFYSASFGIESGSMDIQKRIGKRISLEKCIDIVNSCKRENVVTFAFIIIGLPGETKRTLNETMNFLKRADFEKVHFYIPEPTPGSQLFDIYFKKGLVKLDYYGSVVSKKIPGEIWKFREAAEKEWSRHQIYRELNPFHTFPSLIKMKHMTDIKIFGYHYLNLFDSVKCVMS